MNMHLLSICFKVKKIDSAQISVNSDTYTDKTRSHIFSLYLKTKKSYNFKFLIKAT